MTNSKHIATGALFESARLKDELDSASQSHLNDCDLCRGRLSWMLTASRLGSQEAAYEPPPAVMEKVLRLGRNPGVLKQFRNFIVASLRFDSGHNPAPVGVRRAEATARQVTYEADGIEIGLSLRRSENQTLTLTGQVLNKASAPIEDPAARVDVVVEGDHVATAPLSPWGEFVFPDLPDAQYSLHLSVLDRLVRIPLLPSADLK